MVFTPVREHLHASVTQTLVCVSWGATPALAGGVNAQNGFLTSCNRKRCWEPRSGGCGLAISLLPAQAATCHLSSSHYIFQKCDSLSFLLDESRQGFSEKLHLVKEATAGSADAPGMLPFCLMDTCSQPSFPSLCLHCVNSAVFCRTQRQAQNPVVGPSSLLQWDFKVTRFLRDLLLWVFLHPNDSALVGPCCFTYSGLNGLGIWPEFSGTTCWAGTSTKISSLTHLVPQCRWLGWPGASFLARGWGPQFSPVIWPLHAAFPLGDLRLPRAQNQMLPGRAGIRLRQERRPGFRIGGSTALGLVPGQHLVVSAQDASHGLP